MEAINNLSPETIKLLLRYRLLEPLINELIIEEELSSISIDDNLKEGLIAKFKEAKSIQTKDQYHAYLNSENLFEHDFEEQAFAQTKIENLIKSRFEHQIESRFLERKASLEIVVYSLIRVSNPFLAKEIYYRAIGGEEDIGNLATEFSEGIEKRTRGIVGPVPIESSHPKLTELLKKSKVGEIQKPIQIDNSFVVIRVESHEPVILDEFTRKKMGEELVKIWLKTKVNEMMNKLIDKTESSLIV